MKHIFLCCILCAQLLFLKSQPQIENLVFEGAGIRGVAYGGVIGELEKAGLMQGVVRVAGTSAGAITAMMLALGYNSAEITAIISETKFQRFNDGQYAFFGGLHRLKNHYGWYKADAFDKWLEGIIAAKTGDPEISFSQLKARCYKELVVTGTCLNRQKLIWFSAQTYPHMKVRDAVRASLSIPFYYEALFIDSMGKTYKKYAPGLDIIVDGGITGNFPIYLFDSVIVDPNGNVTRIPNIKTLGIRIDSEGQIGNDSASGGLESVEILDLSDYLQAMYIFTIESLNRQSLVMADWERTISVSSMEIGPKVKRLSDHDKGKLVSSGSICTLRFLQSHEFVLN
jgi:NTE family protein